MNKTERAELNRLLPGRRWQPLRNGAVQAFCGEAMLQVERSPYSHNVVASLWCPESDSNGHWRQIATWERATVTEAIEGLRVQLLIHVAAVKTIAGLEP